MATKKASSSTKTKKTTEKKVAAKEVVKGKVSPPKKAVAKKATDSTKAAVKKNAEKKTVKKVAKKPESESNAESKKIKIPKATVASAPVKKIAVKENTAKKTASVKKAVKKSVKKADVVAEAKKAWEPEKPKPVFIDAVDVVRELPERYADSRLTIMVRDPHWCFAYWDVSEDDRHKHHIDMRSVHVRIFRLLSPENIEHKFEHLDIEVRSSFGAWYIMLGMPNNYFIGELGYYDDNGNFVVLARSSIIFAPREGFSDVYDDEWLLPDDLAQKLYGRVDPTTLFSSASILNLFKAHMFLGGASSSSVGGASSSLVRKDKDAK